MIFSNAIQIIFLKLFKINCNVVVYQYKKYRLISYESYADGVSIQECLAKKVYAEALRQSKPEKRAGSYINIGANIGAFDIAIFDAWGPDTRGITIEMNPWTFARLSSNVFYNKLSTRLINAAVTDRNEILNVPIDQTSCSQSLYHSGPSDQQSQIKTLTLFQIPEPVEGVPVDLLKVDCEGSEYPIFSSVSREELQRFRNVVVEIHTPPTGFSMETLIEDIKSKGKYEATLLSETDDAKLIFFQRSEKSK